jgi:DNA-binding NarL/FixJ family response regulator
MRVRLCFVEDQPVVRLGIVALLAGTDIIVVDEAATVAEAVELAASTTADVVLLDVRLPDGDGLTALARLKAVRPALPVLMFSAYENPAYIARSIALGAAGYVLKGTGKQQLISAIQQAAAGQTIWSKDELRRVAGIVTAPRTGFDLEVPLTRREDEVLRHIASGHTNKQIAEALQISYETVKEHVQHLLKKVGVTDRTQAAIWAIRNGLIP